LKPGDLTEVVNVQSSIRLIKANEEAQPKVYLQVSNGPYAVKFFATSLSSLSALRSRSLYLSILPPSDPPSPPPLSLFLSLALNIYIYIYIYMQPKPYAMEKVMGASLGVGKGLACIAVHVAMHSHTLSADAAVSVMHRHTSAVQSPGSTCPRQCPRGGSAPRRSGPSCTCRRDP
jgi:hypothetical protein